MEPDVEYAAIHTGGSEWCVFRVTKEFVAECDSKKDATKVSAALNEAEGL